MPEVAPVEMTATATVTIVEIAEEESYGRRRYNDSGSGLVIRGRIIRATRIIRISRVRFRNDAASQRDCNSRERYRFFIQ